MAIVNTFTDHRLFRVPNHKATMVARGQLVCNDPQAAVDFALMAAGNFKGLHFTHGRWFVGVAGDFTGGGSVTAVVKYKAAAPFTVNKPLTTLGAQAGADLKETFIPEVYATDDDPDTGLQFPANTTTTVGDHVLDAGLVGSTVMADNTRIVLEALVTGVIGEVTLDYLITLHFNDLGVHQPLS